MKKTMNMDTKLIHSGEPKPRINKAVTMPIFQSAMYEFTDEENYHDIKYIRLNNTPNHLALQKKLADLENADSALVTSSGMAAITSTLLSFLEKGDHLLIQDSLYGGTHTFVNNDLKKWGIEFDFIDGTSPNHWEEKLKPKTKVMYVESLTNPLLHVTDLKAVAIFAKKHNLISIVDNTFPSPINFRPSEWGIDLSCHSCTKYLNGHSDIVAGCVIGSNKFIRKITHQLNHLGGTLDPHACFLLHRGMKTLGLRIKRHNESAIKIAQFLENHPSVLHVHYPGLKTNSHYERANELFDGFSGMVSFELNGGWESANQFMKKVTLPVVTFSLGGVESLVTIPALTSHSGMSREERLNCGISDGLIRMSVGIEHVDDILEDLDNSL